MCARFCETFIHFSLTIARDCPNTASKKVLALTQHLKGNGLTTFLVFLVLIITLVHRDCCKEVSVYITKGICEIAQMNITIQLTTGRNLRDICNFAATEAFKGLSYVEIKSQRINSLLRDANVQ